MILPIGLGSKHILVRLLGFQLKQWILHLVSKQILAVEFAYYDSNLINEFCIYKLSRSRGTLRGEHSTTKSKRFPLDSSFCFTSFMVSHGLEKALESMPSSFSDIFVGPITYCIVFFY